MEYKRLTQRIEGAVVIKNAHGHDVSFFGETINKALDRLAELEDKIENGTLVELPCKVGTMVYYIASYKKKNGFLRGWKICYTIMVFPFELDMLNTYGNNWFLSREEAEKRLKEVQG